jgi:2-(1,2-epoxy-1,2-dihydrophenyl)acetyl-CoA isomerase
MAVVETARDGGVLRVTLNRPDVLNALTAEMHAGLAVALADARDPEVRAVVLTGAGRGFCVGQDLAELRAITKPVAAFIRDNYHATVHTIRNLEKPVIVALNGPTAGAGLSLALAGDYRLASDEATLVPGFVGIGLIPDAGATYFVSRLIGAGRAFAWLTTNRRLSAAEALGWGLVEEVVPAGELTARASELAAAYAAAPTRAVGVTKRLIDWALESSLADQLEREAELQAVLAATDDFHEGVAAFLEKRPPRFTGR